MNTTSNYLKKIYKKTEYFIESFQYDNRFKYILCWIAVILLIFGFILTLNILTPMQADDFSYTLIYGTLEPISSLSDIVKSQMHHYFTWGGRSVVHFIAQAILMLPPIVIDILNSLIYLVYISLTYLLIRGKNKDSLSLFLLVFFSVWFLQPAICDTILWTTGSANYLWGTVLVLIFLIPYRFYQGLNTKSGLNIIISTITFFLFGIIAGWTNENTAGAMILTSILFIFIYYKKKWDIPKWAISGVIGAMIGYGFMIFAPGNMERGKEAMPFDLLVFSYRFVMHTVALVQCCGIILIIYTIFIYIAKSQSKSIKNIENYIQTSTLFLLAMFAGIYAMVISPSFPPRAWFGVITFMIIALGILFYNISNIYPPFKNIRIIFVILIGIGFIFSTYPAIKDIYHSYTFMNEREKQINEALQNGEEIIVIERFRPTSRYTHSEWESNVTQQLSSYYGVEFKIAGE